MLKTPIAIALERQIPEHIREEYALFVDFVKAYYAFLEQTQQRDLENIRSIDSTLDEFIIRFKKELSALFPTTGLQDERFILQRLREFYKTRGSKESYQFLFRAFFNKEAEMFYPSTQILRASDGKWEQEKSIFVEAYSGTELFNLSGKIITIKTAKKHIDVYSPRVKYYRAGMYEVYIDRAYVSDISIGDIIALNGVDVGTISPCPSKYTIVRGGSGFEVGKLYNLPSESGDGSIVKITKVDVNGAIKKIQIISFGLDYESTFFAKLSNTYYQPLEYWHPVSEATIGAGHPSGLWPTETFDRNVVDESGNLLNPADPKAYGDTTRGYIEFGYINRNDYFYYQADYKGVDLVVDADPYFADGTYVGQIIASFYTNAANLEVIDESIAEIQIDLGAVAVYPGYYVKSDGFISDEIYIQDGKYYQLFSYVVKVEQQLDSYADIIKSLLHPAGFELFAQYNIKNDYIVSAVPLEAFVRYQYFERKFARDASYWAFTKNVADVQPTFDQWIGYDLVRTGITDSVDPYELTRSTAQPGVHINKWDIELGNNTNPLTNSIYTVIGNFENRALDDIDTLGFGSSVANFVSEIYDVLVGRDITRGLSDVLNPIHSPGLNWEFAGQTWTDSTGSTADNRSATEWGLGPIDNQITVELLDRTVTYDRSIIPLATDIVVPAESRSSPSTPTVYSQSKTDSVGTTESSLYEFAKFKQPLMTGFTATLVAGSTVVTLTGANGVAFNTFAGLSLIKTSGTGAFGTNAIVDSVSVSPNNVFYTSVPHATSGTIVFNVGASSEEAEIADLANTVTTVHSGLNWEFSGSTFAKSVNSVDIFDRTVAYDKSTVVIEAIIITPVHSGLSWDLSPLDSPNPGFIKTVSVADAISGKSVDKTSIADTTTVTHSGLNWEISGSAFVDSNSVNDPTRYNDLTKSTSDTINTIVSSGTLYYNPYNVNTDASTVFSYTSETYFVSDTRAIT